MPASPVYRLAIDDVIYSFRDLAQRQPHSIFDCHFLALMRDLHRRFGTVITLNSFFQTHEGDFSLCDFPEKYRAEWEANAHWLRLAFHSLQEFPDDRYVGDTLDAFRHDYEVTKSEVFRFAGAQSWIAPGLIHFCRIPTDSLPTLAEWGVRHLAGLNHRKADGAWSGHYGVPDALAAHVAGNELGTEPESGITFSLVDLVINNCPPEQTSSMLEQRADTPARPQKIDLLSHEQYSWPFYPRHLPDHPERLANAIRWCVERGYQPAFYNGGAA